MNIGDLDDFVSFEAFRKIIESHSYPSYSVAVFAESNPVYEKSRKNSTYSQTYNAQEFPSFREKVFRRLGETDQIASGSEDIIN